MTSWPACPLCGGPKLPFGQPELTALFDVDTRIEANLRNRFDRMNRSKAQKQATIDALAIALGEGHTLPEKGPWYVRLTRYSPGTPDTGDNLPGALKAIRDVIAAALKVNDGSPMVHFAYAAPEKGSMAVKIEIWGRPC